jgi:hypothetical protein
MKNSSKSLAISQSLSSTNVAVLQLIVAILLTLMVMGCNTQKTTTATNTDQRPSAQRERAGRPSIDEIFAMDANKDGKLAKSELQGPLLNDFSRIDSNGDGFITRAELENAPQPQRGQGPPKNNQ